MRRIRHITLVLAPCALLLPLISACSTDGDGDVGGGPTDAGAVSGTVLFVPEVVTPLTESEPNDTVDQAQPIGALQPGAALSIRGVLGAGDRIDAFAFAAPTAGTVEARLESAAGAALRAELAVFDPLGMALAARSGADGTLVFHAAGPFDLVVRTEDGEGAYQLAVRVRAPSGAIARAGWIGALSAGDQRMLAPQGTGRFELTSAERQALAVENAAPEAGPVRVFDLSMEPATLLAEVPAAATAVVELAPLQRVALECAGPVLLRSSGAAAALAPPALARVAPLDAERAAWNGADAELVYGRTVLPARAGEVLVKPRAGADLAVDLAARGLVDRDRIPAEAHLAVTQLPLDGSAEDRARATVALVRSLAASPRVEYAELNLIRTVQGGGTFTPDDSFYGLQWHYPLMRLPEAWASLLAFSGGTTPTQVRVAVVDTGRRPHTDLDANTRTDIEYDFITDAAVAGDGGGPDSNAFDVGDSSGLGPSSFHGTHVAGTIAAVTNNGAGIAGVAAVGPVPVQVVHLRVLGIGGGSDFDIARAVRYAAGLTNTGIPTLPLGTIQVINLSLGGPGSSSTMQNAVTAARNAGAVILAAAGNENSGQAFYPAAYAGVISVSAVDRNALKAPYSNFHASVDLCAPGGNTAVDQDGDGYVDGVLSTLVNTAGNPIYVFYQGTSMACPHAAGVAAMMKSIDPSLTPAQIETKLKQTAIDLGAAGQDSIYGAGLVDALAAVQSAGAPGGTTDPVFVVNPVALNFGTASTQLTLALSNGGGGTITVNSAVPGDPWLSLVPTGAAPGSPINVTALRVTVNRAHPSLAAAGDYASDVTIPSSAGTVVVPVNVTVDATPPLDVDLFVLAVDLSGDDLVTIAEGVVNPSITLAYRLDELTTSNGLLLPPGDYLIVCGSDDNDDGFICGDGDTYCGLYPTLNDPALVTVDGNVSGVNFVVAPLPSLPALTGGSRVGYRRLRAERP